MADEPKQSYMEESLPEKAFSMRFARLIMRNRFATLMTLVSIAGFFALPLVNAALYNAGGGQIPGVPRFELNTRARDQWPEHPFIHAQDKFAGRFGTASRVVMEVRKKEGEIYDPDFLEKVSRITDELDKAPFVNHYQVQSISHINTRVIRIEPDGAISAEMLMEEIPYEDEELVAFRELVHQNPGRIYGFLISRDDKAAQVSAGFITHRLDNATAYRQLFDHVMRIKEEEEADGTVEIYVSGIPILTGWVLLHAFEIIPDGGGAGDRHLGHGLHGVDRDRARPADPRDSAAHHGPFDLAHDPDGGALLRGLRERGARARARAGS
jgi:predicted RND superfamily exporter protein